MNSQGFAYPQGLHQDHPTGSRFNPQLAFMIQISELICSKPGWYWYMSIYITWWDFLFHVFFFNHLYSHFLFGTCFLLFVKVQPHDFHWSYSTSPSWPLFSVSTALRAFTGGLFETFQSCQSWFIDEQDVDGVWFTSGEICFFLWGKVHFLKKMRDGFGWWW